MPRTLLPREPVEFDHEIDPWEKQPFESEQAYRAFCLYRDLGEGRSVIAAYRQAEGGKHAAAKRVNGRWGQWSKDYRWAERVAAMETDVAEKARRRRTKQYFQQVKEMRERQYGLAVNNAKTAMALLRVGHKALQELEALAQRRETRIAALKLELANPALTKEERASFERDLDRWMREPTIPVSQLPNYFRTAVAVAESAAAAEANALGLDDLALKLLEAAKEMDEKLSEEPPAVKQVKAELIS